MARETETVRDVVLEHTFDARREVVFKAWTEPKYLAAWWCPHGFTNPVCELDVRPGGKIRLHMRSPDGTIYPMTGVYREIVEPERLVFSTTPLDERGEPLFEILNTVTFVEDGARTAVTVHASVLWAAAEGEVYLRGMEEGWRQSLERLAALVQQIPA